VLFWPFALLNQQFVSVKCDRSAENPAASMTAPAEQVFVQPIVIRKSHICISLFPSPTIKTAARSVKISS